MMPRDIHQSREPTDVRTVGERAQQQGERLSGERVALYVRAADSEMMEDKITGESELLSEYARSRGARVIGTYTDRGEAGDHVFAERPAGRKLLHDAVSDSFSVVLVSDLSRIGTDADTLGHGVESLRGAGLRLATVSHSGEDASAKQG